jgi:hypothetical protein
LFNLVSRDLNLTNFTSWYTNRTLLLTQKFEIKIYMVIFVATTLDFILALLKWPAAIVSLLLLPGSAMAAMELIGEILSYPSPLIWFFIGLVGYLTAWKILFKRQLSGSFIPTLVHELTHALVALATFHPVTNIDATWRDGGKMSYRGKGNWVITIAPYFVPTASLSLVIIMILMPGWLVVWVEGLLGVTVAFHLTSTWTKIHSGQRDLQEVGFPFAFMFLPAANVIWYGLIIEFCWGQRLSIFSFTSRLIENTFSLLELFL